MRSVRFASTQRITIISMIIIISAAVLGFRLFQMQILNQTSYQDKATDNSIKSIEQIPLRGVFYDRNSKLLVNNVPAYTLRITPADYDKKLNKVIETILEVDSGYVSNILFQYKNFSKYFPIKIKRGIDFDVVAWLEENSLNLPGVDYIVEMRRGYPGGINGSHIFGYLKEISQKQLEKENKYYHQGDNIGNTGIEKTYEKKLRGTKGNKFVIVNSRRKVINAFNNGAEDILPIKGNDLILTIEVNAQRVAEEEFKEKKGGLVAIDPTTGDILALVSAPEFDLNEFSYITPKDYLQTLYNDPGKPLFNRATTSIQSPGSTYKVLAAIAALDMGIITTSTTFFCSGGVTFGRFFKCHGVHGNVNVITAIEKSCNSFFYQLILKIGIDNWAKYGRLFGFGSKTGIDIGEENAGLIPDAEYYKKRYGPKWPKSIMLSLAIGQGEVSVTPLQLAQYTALIANNGIGYQPHLAKGFVYERNNKVVDFEYKKIDVGIDQKIFDIVKEGMFLVVNGEGTATHLRWGEYEISGKTGTAQNPQGEDHAWFIAFAPSHNPKIAIAVMVENVGFGGTHAAPIAKKVIEAYLNSLKENIPENIKSITKLENKNVE
ncbi:MAG: penicillin-binding protein 2 [Ignavibacteriae bacterium]|nr:MAG: penicillin-binding protein 2 [Ignavibacteriota bacterium]